VSAVQRLTPPALRGRVMGALEGIGALCPALGLSLGGLLVQLSTPRWAFLVVGIGAALTTLLFARVSIERTGQATATAVPVGQPAAERTSAAKPGEAPQVPVNGAA